MGGLNANLILQGTQAPAPTPAATPQQQLDTLSRIRQYQQQQALAPLQQQELANKVQEGALAIQQTQENNADQAAIQRAFHDPANSAPDPVTGQMVPDHEKVRAAIQPIVKTSTLQGFDSDYLKMQQAATTLATSKIKNDQDKWTNTKNLNQMAGETLAATIGADPDQKQTIWTQGLANLKAAGVDTTKYPPVVPDDNTLKAYANSVGYLGTILTNADKTALEEQRKAKAAKDAVAAKVASTNAMHAEAATAFQGIDNKADYDQAVKDFASQDDDHAAYAKRYLQALPYSDKAVDTINSRALTAEQRQQAKQAAAKPTVTSPIEAALEWAKAAYPDADAATQYDKALSRYSAMNLEGKRDTATTGGKVDRQQQKETLSKFDKAQQSESEMYGDLARYQDAIDSGQTFLQQTQHGLSASSMDKYTNGDDSKTQAAISDMKQRADILRDKIAATIKQKYDYASRLGAEPDVPVEQAVSSVTAGKYNVGKPAANATPAATTQPLQAAPAGQPSAQGVLPKGSPVPGSSFKVGDAVQTPNGQMYITGYNPVTKKAITSTVPPQ